MDKKTKIGGAAALMSALLYGGAQLLDMEARLAALEDMHPALDAPAAPEPAEEPVEPGHAEESPEEPEGAEEPVEAEADSIGE